MITSYLKQIYEKRSLIWTFAVTDLKLRYRNSVLGFFWTILEPLLMLTVLYLVFNYLLHSTIEHYPLFLLISLIIWNTFARGTSMASNSILVRSGVILTIFMPRIILPFSTVVTAILMMFFELLVFVVFVIAFQFQPPLTALFFPIALIPLFLLTFGLAFPLSALNILYRDVNYIWAVIIQAGFFLTPIIYNIDTFPKVLQGLLFLNPMSQIVIWTRNFVLYGNYPSFESMVYTFSVSSIIFVIGFIIFRRLENKIVDKL